MSLQEGSEFGPYRILSRIEAGGMGEVFRARHEALDRVVALKVIRDDRNHSADALRRFHREMEVSVDLRHPNLVRVYDASVIDGRAYMAMEFVEGTTLDRWVLNRTFDRLTLTKVAVPLAQGLDYLHGRGIVHRDLKPRNVLVTQEDIVKIVDFGLAKGIDSAAYTRKNQTVGTPYYLPPEVIAGGSWSPAGDRYSLGVLLYELCSDHLPFNSSAEMTSYLVHIVERDPVPLRERGVVLGSRIEGVLMGLIDRNPDRRPSLRQLIECFEGPPGSIWTSLRSDPQTIPILARRAAASHPMRAASFLAAVGTALFLALRPASPPATAVTGITPASSPRTTITGIDAMMRQAQDLTRELSRLDDKERDDALRMQPGDTHAAAALGAKAAYELRRLLRACDEGGLSGALWLDVEQVAGDMLEIFSRPARRTDTSERELAEIARIIRADTADPFRQCLRDSLEPLTQPEPRRSLNELREAGLERAIARLGSLLGESDTPLVHTHHLRLLDEVSKGMLPLSRIQPYMEDEGAGLPPGLLASRRRQLDALEPLPPRLDSWFAQAPKETRALNSMILLHAWQVVEDHRFFDSTMVTRALTLLDSSWKWLLDHGDAPGPFDARSRARILEASAAHRVSLRYYR